VHTERTDPYCLGADEQDTVLKAAPWQRFVVVGDSLAEGLGQPSEGYQNSPWPRRVATALRRARPELTYLNLGRRNLRAAQVREQQLDAALRFRPDLAAVVCGGNDLIAPDPDLGQVGEELQTLVQSLASAGATVVLFRMMNVGRAFPATTAGLTHRLDALNDRVAAIARDHDAVLVDLWNHEASGFIDAYSADRIHASMRGHAIIATEVIKSLGGRC